jgi:type I restriction enzyme S subunit
MSFPRYPEYNDSGVEWLGEVPAHWEVHPMRNVVATSRAAVEPAEMRDGMVFHYSIPAVQASGTGEIEDGASLQSNKLLISEVQVLISKLNPRKGTVCIAGPQEFLTVCSTEFVPLIPRTIRLKYLSYIVQASGFRSRLESMVESVTRSHQRVEPRDILNMPIVVPSSEEQACIESFLDSETAKIDALVAEQERLIALLQEKRQAVISHAVTKGLNPDAPMKDSGVEWLGEVPAHWEVTTVKRVARIKYGIGEPPAYSDTGTPLVRATNVHAGQITEAGLVFVNPSEIPQQRIVWLEAGDIIVVRSGAYTGDSAIVPEGFGQCIAGFDMVLRCFAMLPMFMQFSLLSYYLKARQIEVERMRAAQPHLNAEELGSCLLLRPPATEQSAIVAFLEEAMAKIDDLALQQQRAVDLLLERRSALIAAAVTGQIDVRGLAPAEAA